MRSRITLTAAVVVTLLVSAWAPTFALAAPNAPYSRQISSAGTTALHPTTPGDDALQWPEFPGGGDADADGAAVDSATGIINRSQSPRKPAQGASANSGKKAKSNPELDLSFDGLNFRDQRLANGGNQFSVEPPDQGLCAGNGYVMESLNDVVRVFDTAGNPLVGVTDLNSFYGYAPAIARSAPPVFGPFVTDPSCYFDLDTQRWFQIVLTLDTVPSTGAFTGTNHLDLAVSTTSSPLGGWRIYRLPAQDDGTAGTPNHGCSRGAGQGPCLGDYPHIGADANGFYITTNEYSFFGPEFKGAQLYAMSKRALAAGATSLAVVQFDTAGAVAGNPGFTVWPATSPAGAYATDLGGTEYFLSSMAAQEAGNTTGVDNRLAVWALTNTRSLNGAHPALRLANSIIGVNPYGIPPLSEQKAGDFPLGQCLNDTTLATPFGPGCWRNFFVSGGPFGEVESHLDSNDTRMQQVTFANGKLWGALDTAITVGGATKAGIAWYIIKPEVSNAGVSGTLALQGYLALANNNLTYPAIGVTASGRGVMAFTVVGNDYYPSAGYAAIDAQVGVGDVHLAAAGLGPSDGFTSYKAFVGSPPRTRWGDYGAAVTDGNSIWIASEYIGQTCTLAQYTANTAASPLFSCSRTRASLGNWGTRISKVTP
ncbi:MAG TPA: hypothetical protein VFW96_08015 [Thermomicrobiales bacterium]|nr:hypothetical protein [Thermomicrobiales bacterium]